MVKQPIVTTVQDAVSYFILRADGDISQKGNKGALDSTRFFRTFLSQRRVEEQRVGSSCTDGTHIWCDPKFFASLTIRQAVFVLAHEVCHIIFKHHMRTGSRIMEIAQIATDLAINPTLVNFGFEAPPGVLMPSKFNLPADLAWEEYYDLLLKQIKDGTGPGQEAENLVEKAKKDHEEATGGKGKDEQKDEDDEGDDEGDGEGDGKGKQKSKGKGKGKSKPDEDDDGEEAEGQASSEGDADDDQDGDEQESNDTGGQSNKGVPDPGRCGGYCKPEAADQQDIAEQEEELDRQLLSASKACQSIGNLPGNIRAIIEELLPPQVTWKERLRHFATLPAQDKRSYARLNRRTFSSGIFLPSQNGNTMEHLVISWDSSGSCFTKEFGETFAAEVVNMLKPWPDMNVTLFYNDTRVKDPKTFKASRPFKITPSGGGGTDHRPVFKFVDSLKQKPTVFILLTDLYTQLPEPSYRPHYPVIWCVINNTVSKIPFGERIDIKLNGVRRRH